METTAQQTYERGEDRTIPIGMGVLGAVVLLVVCAVLAARLTGFTPAEPELAAQLESRMLGFRDRSGSVEIYDWETGEDISRIAPGEGSFLRGVMRSLVRQRRGTEIPEGAPFLLARYAGGRLMISDPATGERIDLIAFGPDNLAVFAELLHSSSQASFPSTSGPSTSAPSTSAAERGGNID